MNNNSRISFNRLAVLGLWTLLLVGTIRNAVDVVSTLLLGMPLESVTTLVTIVSMGLLAISLVPVFLKEKGIILFTLIVFALVWYRSSLQNPQNIPFLLSNMQSFFFEGLPYLWFFAYFLETDSSDSMDFFQLLYKICRVKLIIALATQLVMFILPQADIFHDYMNAANALLLGLLVVTAHNMHFKHRIKSDTFLEILTIVSIAILGSRGGVMCYGSFYILYFIFLTNNKKKKTIVFCGIVALLFLFLLSPRLVSLFAGSNNRLVEMFSSNTLLHDENRTFIYGILISEFLSNPWGMGVMADRAILTTSKEIWETFYAHNLFLELIVDFGYIGIILSLVLVHWIIKSLKRSSIYNGLILCALISCSFVKLMVSTSLWVDPIFWALIGSMLARQKKIMTLPDCTVSA